MDADLTIIGAGVIGLAVASEFADDMLRLYILEKNESHGLGISSRNSEVIHAGIYYPYGSLKANLCMEGRELIYDTCKKENIPHKRLGKLIIATSVNEISEIEELLRNATGNGVKSLSMLDHRQIGQIEPGIKAVSALFSPDTGILSVHCLMDYYLRNAKNNGAEIVYGTEVKGIAKVQDGYKISTFNTAGELFEFTTEKVINAAGLQSDIVAKMTGTDYSVSYCKGDYFSISNTKPDIVKRLIYPVPEINHVGLGVHLTLDLNGRMRLGPDAVYIDRIEDYKVDSNKRDIFYQSAVKFLPFIRKEDLVPDMSGIRPKLQKKGEGVRDFVISEDLPGFVNLVGIESPGLTAAPAIARYVKKILTA